jgi:hypothetical protein
MCATDKVTFVDAMHRTNLNARTATGTLGIINGRKVIHHGNRAVRTGFLALHTTDTAVGASLTGDCAFIVVRAFHNNAYGIGNEMDDAIGAFARTDTATDARLGIDTGNTVFHGNRVFGTYANTVAITKTRKVTEAVARIVEVSSLTGLRA